MNVFIDTSDKLVAAIDYCIRKYGDEPWLPAALMKTTSEYIMLVDRKEDDTPLEIFKLNNKEGYSYNGFHYIINQIEKYFVSTVNARSYQHLCFFLLFIIIIIIILLIK